MWYMASQKIHQAIFGLGHWEEAFVSTTVRPLQITLPDRALQVIQFIAKQKTKGITFGLALPTVVLLNTTVPVSPTTHGNRGLPTTPFGQLQKIVIGISGLGHRKG